ncbi:16S rRNA (adenine(1518)-N(6)/adenine(1519)-N(6))-dimethyltransferase RsmA [Prosthecochloris sp. N3]|uniref:Ribosomal RNA small subunit methyltransferase A n=1 Tax=Prosthecochloris ethylica TaxID=2743976 RepID=A0ABR9XSN5_9CHLB|nr:MULTISPECIES: 16S rRNA (adenine(1518)-N(6)/adenine(1519)-N(6))-dimethyltransferase RsmA [Prosthecochloris]MBF0586714.1 16S rRNA (adenine(1518)-N(6)/adenine(1519)-N(6))-dimethyltransferase RsmA [Prosthecochloris ethylica]MBF0636932.1 16S rRNA (adenine(1518)-N(6)/adenine(1519)-N(6))-dimethyltransferase RsmA [Prosthecochloris ethylica]NUK47803.1 16S rRNA (adenine(1518)-N(6)/adenine(1519)-N(6))-dimethyltransferase RsmA [Prosthecochloris ethylica]RNA65050.1 16S rRNA (adenine(1518)-N(6)/adenine(15
MTKVEYKHTEIAVKKKLGQNFLTDRNIIRKIVRSAQLDPDDNVVEIGPGFGALTREICNVCQNVTAVEKDPALASFIRSEFPSVNLVEGDILKVDFQELAANGQLKVMGNIPYSITSPILFKLLENRRHIISETLMMQHEVALRLAARPGTKEYGILAVQLQTFCDVRYLFKVGKKVFRPRPEVDSAVVGITPRSTALDRYEHEFRTFVRTAFRQRRKTLQNNLRENYNLSGISSVDLQRRAESLSVDEFQLLFTELHAGS